LLISEGRLDGVQYDDSLIAGICLVTGGNCKSLIDALIFPLYQGKS
jgi:hypothetical protein